MIIEDDDTDNDYTNENYDEEIYVLDTDSDLSDHTPSQQFFERTKSLEAARYNSDSKQVSSIDQSEQQIDLTERVNLYEDYSIGLGEWMRRMDADRRFESRLTPRNIEPEIERLNLTSTQNEDYLKVHTGASASIVKPKIQRSVSHSKRPSTTPLNTAKQQKIKTSKSTENLPTYEMEHPEDDEFGIDRLLRLRQRRRRCQFMWPTNSSSK